MMCVAMKDFVGNGEDVVRNQLVDGDTFRNIENLLTARYLRPASHDEIENATLVGEEDVAPLKKKKGSLRARKARTA